MISQAHMPNTLSLLHANHIHIFSYISPWESFIQTLHHYYHTTFIKHERVRVSVQKGRQELKREAQKTLFASSYLKGYFEDFRATKI